MSKNQTSSQCKNRVDNIENNNKNDDLSHNMSKYLNQNETALNEHEQNFESLVISITQQEINDIAASKSNHSFFDLNNKTLSLQQAKNKDSESNWQNKKGCVVERISHLFLNEELSDIALIVGRESEEKERFHAHKFVLSISSSVFNTMFYGTGQKMSQSSDIIIPDVDPRSFKSFLRFLYTDEIVIEPDTVCCMLYISKKYVVIHLEKACVEYLKKNLRIDNALMLLNQALLFDESQLSNLCLDLIDKFCFEVLLTDYFLECDLQVLKLILKRDSLNIRESKLHECIIKWAQTQCQNKCLEKTRENIQKILDDEIIDLIRWPSMSKEEFALIVSCKDNRLLSDEKIIEMFLYLNLNNPKRETKFNTIPRGFGKLKHTLHENVINRFCQVESRWGYSGTSDRIRFSVDKHIYILGVGLYGSIYGKCEYQTLIQLIHFETCTICAQNNTSFQCDGSSNIFRVLFQEPVEIEPNTDYIIAATLKGPDSYYGCKGLRKITHDNPVNGNKVTFSFQYASGNNNGSSVEDGQLPEIIFVYNL